MADDATAELFEPELAERVLARALAHGGDFAELYAERRTSFSVALDDRKMERALSGSELGAAIRVVAGDATYFGHVDGLAEPDLERLADSVAAAVRGTSAAAGTAGVEAPAGQAIEQPPETVPRRRKAEMLRECDERARAAAARSCR